MSIRTLAPRGDEEKRVARAAHVRERMEGARAVVVGLGTSGVAAARLLHRLGANVTGTDAAPLEKLSDEARALAASGIRLVAGGHAEAGIEKAALVVVSPGVPRIAEIVAAEGRGVEVIGELELATRLLPHLPSVAITGSNGKSTTTLLVGELLSSAGFTPFVGGNLGAPPSDLVDTEADANVDVLVLEVSSYQAERMPTFRARSAALLNASENHLDRYDAYADYVHAKGNLLANLGDGDVAVIPAGSLEILAQAKRGRGTIVTFGEPGGEPPPSITCSRERIVDRERGLDIRRSDVLLAGDHNAANVAAALGLVRPFDVAEDAIRRVLSTFRGLPHRIAFVEDVGGVRFYDDSKGTNVGASVAAIRGLSETRVVLIAGGRDKLGSYAPLVSALADRGRGVVLIGEAADRIAEAVGTAVPVVRASSMEEAVALARTLASPGDAVLLSPACSSFDMFRDYKHRGDAFVDAVRHLGRA